MNVYFIERSKTFFLFVIIEDQISLNRTFQVIVFQFANQVFDELKAFRNTLKLKTLRQ